MMQADSGSGKLQVAIGLGNLPVVSQVVLSPEGLLADVTSVRALVSVSALMNKQVVRFGKASLAVLADELLLGPGGTSAES